MAMNKKGSERALLIRINIENQDGWFVATSKDLNGFVLAHPKESELLRDLPNAIKLLIDVRYGIECKVVPSEYGKRASRAKTPWLVVPASVENISLPVAA